MLMSLRRLVVPTLCFAMLSAPAAAQPGASELQLVAFATSGLFDGARIYMGTLEYGNVAVRGNGLYEITFENGKVATFVFSRFDDCVYDMVATMAGEETPPVRFNFNLATGLDYRDQGEFQGLNAVLLTIAGPPEVMQGFVNDAWVNQPIAVSSLLGSATVEQVKGAGDTLMQMCHPPAN